MKLADIDILNTERKNYNHRAQQLDQLDEAPGSISFGKAYFNEPEYHMAMRVALRAIVQRQFDEAKTKLMMLGITEFPPE